MPRNAYVKAHQKNWRSERRRRIQRLKLMFVFRKNKAEMAVQLQNTSAHAFKTSFKNTLTREIRDKEIICNVLWKRQAHATRVWSLESRDAPRLDLMYSFK